MKWEEHLEHTGQGTGVYRILVGKPKGKRPLGRPRRILEDRWRALANAVMNLPVQ